MEHFEAFNQSLSQNDPEIFSSIKKESSREEHGVELIASENYASKAVMEAQGSLLTNKYAEGYSGKRYYGGCAFVDEVETLAENRAKKLFGANHANVQPHSGSQANMAAYLAVAKFGDKIVGMSLAHGGHLTHGSSVNFSGKLFEVHSYGLHPETNRLDYDQIRDLVKKVKPKILVAGASAYPREIDFKIMGEIAREHEAHLIVDMAHIAGLVAAGLHNNPVPHATFTTSTTHKTLRGPRGGIILSGSHISPELNKTLNSQIFPGIQGGPLMHIIAAKAVAFGEALKPEFIIYQKQVIENARSLATLLTEKGFHLVTGGTDNHLMLLDLSKSKNFEEVTGKDAEKWLDLAHITVNKNAVPGDARSPFITSGIRIGTPAVTTRGFKKEEMAIIADAIEKILSSRGNESVIQKVGAEINSLCKKFPLYSS